MESKTLYKVLFSLPIIIIVIVGSVLIARHGLHVVNNLSLYYERHPLLTVGAFFGLYAIKSVSFGLPFALLYIGVGSTFPLGWALLINCVGILINMQIPYLIGRFAAKDLVQKTLSYFPRLKPIEKLSQNSALLFSFLVKFIGKIPHEISNMLLGSLHVPYFYYLLGGVLGLLPTMVATTIIGGTLERPFSPLFITSVIVVTLLTIFSFIIYRRRVRSNSS